VTAGDAGSAARATDPAARLAVGRIERLRPVWVSLTIVLLALAALEAVALYRIIADQHAVGTDLDFFTSIARRWLDTGVWYTDRQLAGPYETQTLVDNLYPPHALYLFLPFLVLPAALWWAIPLGTIGAVVWWCRPAVWAWPILALIVLLPKTLNQIIYGNTDMWIAAFVALSVRYAWPATLVTIKPSVLFFAVLGIRSRSWWLAALVLGLLSLPFLALWLEWPTVILNSSSTTFIYSLSNLPFFSIALVAWAVSTRRAEPMRPWLGHLLGHWRTRGPTGREAPAPVEAVSP
jgi:hypothetical protein